MNIAEFCRKLDKHLEKFESVEDRVKATAEILSQAFKVSTEEVAIFLLDPDRDIIHFHWPLKLKKIGFVPLSSRDSLAARTARDNKSFRYNRFASVHHSSIFEKIKLDDEKPQPIQKIISAPIPADARGKGVLQISRKGPSEDSVKDFKQKDLDNLAAIAKTLSSHF